MSLLLEKIESGREYETGERLRAKEVAKLDDIA